MKLNCLNLAIADAFNVKRFFWLDEHKSDCAKEDENKNLVFETGKKLGSIWLNCKWSELYGTIYGICLW